MAGRVRRPACGTDTTTFAGELFLAVLLQSGAAATLWEFVRERHGFARFATVAAAQLPRWESAHGWSRGGWGRLADKEASLASVLSRMLRIPDTWTVFADCYLDADRPGRRGHVRSRWSYTYPDSDSHRSERTRNLAGWHSLLLEHLAGSQAEDRLDRLVSRPALGGPELIFVRAQPAQLRGDIAAARKVAQECAQKLPRTMGSPDSLCRWERSCPPPPGNACGTRPLRRFGNT